MANTFPSDSVLLVSEFQGSVGDALDGGVIQGRGQSGMDGAIYGEMDVSQLEGLGAGVGTGGLCVFGRPEEPVEGDDNEVEEMSVEGPVDGISGVEDVEGGADDGEVDRVSSVRRVIVAFHGVEESLE